ncbi:tail fiber domain-containing protein [Bradyrhizobium roseum]|uniref:tail fiber domain-containing protein n=1 Tax=Bradyrhizobium roseum TaxID=3056648 RepID=UPI00261EC9D3|nr:tail fiber domain-containing protein [Bradyrhizobium roseus]WKA31610.1 tail fiber domain-containing protein [Bradyrhizobium roseus]
MDTPSPPPAPDPVATAKAQGDMNANTAITSQLLNQTDQVTPYGTLKYDQTGSSTFTGADGKTYTVPKFQATQTLSPTEQALFDLANKTKTNLGQIGVDQSAKIGSLLGTNVNLDTAAEDKINKLASARLDPRFARDEDALRTRLTNQGIQPGSQAWNAEMTNFQQGRNDAYNQLALTGRSQGVSEALAERNQPINEISALLSGSQVSQPNFAATPQTNVAGVDYTGLVNNNYNAANQQYNAQVGQQNAMMGGMFGLAGTLGSAGMKYGPGLMAMSDRRLKSDIVRIGTTPHGLPFYEYSIFGRREQGVMADEVEAVMPEAVAVHPSGFRMVDYRMLGLR